MENIIYDKHLRKYQVAESNSKDWLRFNINYRGTPIGYVNCYFEGDGVLYLYDFHIKDKAIHPPWFSQIGSFPPLRWRTFNYRNRGIGTAMIEFLARFAREKSPKRIEGKVKRHDFKNNPELSDWYRRRGFAVVMGDEKTPFLAKIFLTV